MEVANADDDTRAWRSALLITLVAALVRFVFAERLPLFPDETYYWDWSRHLAAGYFDHPPAIAVLIRAGTSLAAESLLEAAFCWIEYAISEVFTESFKCCPVA